MTQLSAKPLGRLFWTLSSTFSHWIQIGKSSILVPSASFRYKRKAKDYLLKLLRGRVCKSSFTQLPARSECFYLLAELVHWSCSSKFMCLLINLAFQGMVVEVQLPAKFCLYCFEQFRLQIIWDTIIFLFILSYFLLLLPRCFDWWIAVLLQKQIKQKH